MTKEVFDIFSKNITTFPISKDLELFRHEFTEKVADLLVDLFCKKITPSFPATQLSIETMMEMIENGEADLLSARVTPDVVSAEDRKNRKMKVTMHFTLAKKNGN